MEFSNRCLYGLFKFFNGIPLLKRLYPALQKGWAALTWTGGYKVKRYNGLFFLLNYKNLVDRKIGLHGGHEPERLSYLFSQVKVKHHAEIFLDVGANIGLYTLHAVQLGVPEVHAFEPDPRNYAQLMGNLYLNKFTDVVRAHQFGLSDQSAIVEFDMSPDTKTGNTKIATAPSPISRKLTVKPLDEVLSCAGKAIVLKIDVEGHELSVLKGAAQLLANNDCFLQVEVQPEDAATVSKNLEALGYKQIHRIQNDYYFQRASLAAAH
jgi:FkbM family methyltransferase